MGRHKRGQGHSLALHLGQWVTFLLDDQHPLLLLLVPPISFEKPLLPSQPRAHWLYRLVWDGTERQGQ